MSIEVRSELHIYERNGEPVPAADWKNEKLGVLSHWNSRDRVVLDFNGTRIAVVADDLVAAIQNAQNKGRR